MSFVSITPADQFQYEGPTASWGMVYMWPLSDIGGSTDEFLLPGVRRAGVKDIWWWFGLYNIAHRLCRGCTGRSSVEDCTCCHERCEEDKFGWAYTKTVSFHICSITQVWLCTDHRHTLWEGNLWILLGASAILSCHCAPKCASQQLPAFMHVVFTKYCLGFFCCHLAVVTGGSRPGPGDLGPSLFVQVPQVFPAITYYSPPPHSALGPSPRVFWLELPLAVVILCC